jgi:16S rRNA (adenine1518-N6/adenine1519-N6)-dimethyltransferase
MATADRSPRQTLSYLRDLFEARGLRPKSKLGQSFLIDLNLLDLIVRVAELDRGDLALEVGTGSGSLTARLAEQAGQVLGVELDAGFCALARETTAAYANVTLLNVDALKNKNQINPVVLDALGTLLARPEIKRLKLVANLPYVVATPVITNFLLTELPFERMVVTIQWELAERLVARPSTKDYSALSVLVQSLAAVEVVRRMPPQAFWPRPKVDSAIVLIRPDPARRALIADLPAFHDFIRDLYLHRRKNLRGALLPVVRGRFTKESLDERLHAHGFDPAGRAEALTVEEHRKLWEALRA